MWKKGSKESKINRKDRMSQFVYYYTIIYTTTATAAVAVAFILVLLRQLTVCETTSINDYHIFF